MENIQNELSGGEKANLECPKCHNKKIWKRGYDKSGVILVQRYKCPTCETSFSKKSYKEKPVNNNRQLCAYLKAKKLETTTAIKTVVGEEKNHQRMKFQILEQLRYMERQNYAQEYIRLNRSALNTLMNRGANLFDSDSVKDVIAKQKWSDNRRRNVINVYDLFAKLNTITWEKPRINLTQKIPRIPSDEDINDLIAGSPKKLSTFLLLLSETAMRRGEAKRLEWKGIDSERCTITLNEPEKKSNARIWKVSVRLILQINSLSKESQKVFGESKMDSLKSTYLQTRKKLAIKLQKPQLLYITFHTFRHWKAAKLLHQTKDLSYVRDFLGHKSIKNTEIYATVERGIFGANSNDEYIVKTVDNKEDLEECLSVGFDYVCQKDNLIFLRKRK